MKQIDWRNFRFFMEATKAQKRNILIFQNNLQTESIREKKLSCSKQAFSARNSITIQVIL